MLSSAGYGQYHRQTMDDAALATELIDLRALISEDRSELALSKLRKIIRETPDDAEAQELVATASLRAHQPEEALRAADAALEIDPERAECWHIRAKVLLELEQFELAARSAEEACRIEPMIVGYQRLRARTLLRCGDLADARKAAEVLSTLAPDEPDGRLILTRVDQLTGKRKRAEKQARQLVNDFH